MIILASQSPRRAQIIQEAGLEVDIRPQDIDETPLLGEHPKDLVARLARLKCEAALLEATAEDIEMFVVAADTVVWMGDSEFGKPRDEADAKRMLTELSGKTHHVSTGVCITKVPALGEHACFKQFVETTDVSLFDLTDAEIDVYILSKEPMDKAGAYGYQGLGRSLVKKIVGDYYNVVGLPIAYVLRCINTFK